MKRKFISVLLCVALIFTLSVNVFANDTQTIPIVEENGSEIIEIENQGDSNVMPLAQTTGIINGGVYRIKNVASGKYMNVDYGIDANGTNIYQWTGDGSTEQKFKVVYSSSTDSYMFYAMCSSNGTNRVLDVTRGSTPLTSGQNIKLYNPTDPTSQEIKIVSLGSNKYKLVMRANQNLAITSYGTSNGSAGGTTATSAGNIFISTYTSSTNQQWQFELLESPYATPIGYLEEVSSSVIRGWAYRSDVPNTALEVHIYITNNSTSDQTVYATTANLYRSDLESAGYGNGYHAFRYAINWKTFKPGTYTVRAYAIGVGGNNPQLTGSPKTFTVRPMYGVVDSVGDNIEGWVWKPDAPNSVVQAHIYIYRPNGEQVFVVGVNANSYRSDVAAAGYGTGYYGFSYPINWSSLPEERLSVKVYAVDGSGTHPLIYSGYYENRMQITLLGMIESKYQHDLSAWCWTDEIQTYCNNIGCSSLIRRNCADDDVYSYTRAIKNSSYCVIFTHGTSDGEALEWSMYGLYNDPLLGSEYGYYDIDDINALPNGIFSNTRCVVLMSCHAGVGEEENPDNVVNTLHNKGVRTVVGFRDKIWYSYRNTDPDLTVHTDDIINVDQGAQLWITRFTYWLSVGCTVDAARGNAYTDTETANLELNNYTKYELDNNLIPEKIKEEKILCGLDKSYVAGDKYQIVKH